MGNQQITYPSGHLELRLLRLGEEFPWVKGFINSLPLDHTLSLGALVEIVEQEIQRRKEQGTKEGGNCGD